MLVKRKVAVRVTVTDEFRRQLTDRLQQALQKVDSTQQQLEHQGRQYLSELADRSPAQADEFRRRLERQKRRQETIRTRLSEELARAEKLETGDEYPQGSLEGFVEVRVGDSISEKLQQAVLVVKDGLVIEIRHG